MNKRKLRIGLLLDSNFVYAWQYAALERLIKSGVAEFCVLILQQDKTIVESKIKKLTRYRKIWVYSVFQKIDHLFFAGKPNAFAERNIHDLFPEISKINILSVHEKGRITFSTPDIEKISAYRLDILVKMGSDDLIGNLFKSAKFGIWTYYHDDIRTFDKSRMKSWAIKNYWPETGSTLQILKGEHEHIVIYRSWSLAYISPEKTRNEHHWLSVSFLTRQVELLYSSGEEKFFQLVKKYQSDTDMNFIVTNKFPSNFESLKLLINYLLRSSIKVFQKLFLNEQWFLLFDRNDKLAGSIDNFRKIVPPKDRYWADPHIIEESGKHYIFVEELPYSTRRGHIAVIEMNPDGKLSESVTLLKYPYHLSYPCVFHYDDTYYMIPESSENQTVCLYECKEFPYRWELKMNLLENIAAADTTPFFYNNKWWLFTNVAENEGSSLCDELFIFYADTLFTGNWTPHPLNPVISDVKRSRPAGRIFIRDRRIYRPSQNGSVTYGYALNINEILVLSESEYLEKRVESIVPDWDSAVKATHTFTSEGDFKIIDALHFRRKYF